jgi:hypothetical protein
MLLCLRCSMKLSRQAEFTEARRKSNKSSQESIANSHSLATYRDATSHQANSIPKHHANDNDHGNRCGDGYFCQRSQMAASMRPQLPGQETFCEAFCYRDTARYPVNCITNDANHDASRSRASKV